MQRQQIILKPVLLILSYVKRAVRKMKNLKMNVIQRHMAEVPSMTVAVECLVVITRRGMDQARLKETPRGFLEQQLISC